MTAFAHSRKHLLIFVMVLSVALTARVLVAFFSDLTWFNTDSHEYVRMARSILAGQPYSYFPNGYPLVVAAVMAMVPDRSVAAVLVALNVALSVGVVALTYGVAQELAGDRTLSAWAALAIALYPNQINHARQIQSEVVTTFLLMLGIYLWFRSSLFWSGFTIFLAVLCRSSLWPTVPMFIVCCLSGRGLDWPMVVRFTAGVALGFVLNTGAGAAGLVKPSTNLEKNLLIAVASSSAAPDFYARSMSVDQALHPVRTYVRFAHDHPGEFALQRWHSLQELWGWPGGGGRTWQVRVLIAIRLPLVILACVGLYLRRHDAGAWLVFAPLAAVTVVHVLVFSTSRFSYVAEPAMIVLAMIAILHRGRPVIE